MDGGAASLLLEIGQAGSAPRARYRLASRRERWQGAAVAGAHVPLAGWLRGHGGQGPCDAWAARSTTCPKHLWEFLALVHSHFTCLPRTTGRKMLERQSVSPTKTQGKALDEAQGTCLPVTKGRAFPRLLPDGVSLVKAPSWGRAPGQV